MAHTILLAIFLAILSIISPYRCTGQLTGNLTRQPTKPKFTAIYIFGDSLLDTGNNNYIATTFKANHPPYGISFPGGIATGRFSDGKLMSDLMASALGIKETVPPFLDPNLSAQDIRTGVCFASAGSGLDDMTTAFSGVIPVSAQPGYMIRYIEKLKGVVGEEEANRILNGGLVVLTAGSNDMGISYYNSLTRRSFSVDGYQNYLLQRLRLFIQKVYSLGPRNFIISGLPPVGCGPLDLAGSGQFLSCLSGIDVDSQAYNKKLITLLPQLEASLPGSKIAYADIYTPFFDMVVVPAKYGFITSYSGCCVTGLYESGYLCNPFSMVCPDRSKYMFFDSIHPTEAAYKIILRHWLDTAIPHFS